MKTDDIIPGMFDIQEAVKAQAEYCMENEFPLFAPSGGNCWRCEENIYAPIQYGNNEEYISGITVQRAANEHIIRHPHCNYNFIENNMKDFAYACWRVLKFMLAIVSVIIATGASYAYYDNPRFDTLSVLIIGIACSIYLFSEKL